MCMAFYIGTYILMLQRCETAVKAKDATIWFAPEFFSTKWHFCCVGLLLARHVLYVSPHDSNFHVRRVREWSLDKLGIVKAMLQNTTGAENKHINLSSKRPWEVLLHAWRHSRYQPTVVFQTQMENQKRLTQVQI